MRFIGNKQNLLDFIFSAVQENKVYVGTFIDIFSGTTSVAKYYKSKGFKVISNDLLYFSYVFQKAYIENSSVPLFKGLHKDIHEPTLISVLSYLNCCQNGKEGFIYKNFTLEGTKTSQFQRNFFSEDNAKKIDAIRDTIEQWYSKKLLTENEYFVLISSLLEAVPYVSNIAGTYGAFLKNDDPRKFKLLELKIPMLLVDKSKHCAHNLDGNTLIENIKGDVLYVDPPYNERQYAANYHILEHIAVWDKKIIENKTGLRNYEMQKSNYCKKNMVYKVTADLIDKAINRANVKHVLFSYNSEGLLTKDELLDIHKQYGKVTLYEKPYQRYNSHKNGNKVISEYLTYLKVK